MYNGGVKNRRLRALERLEAQLKSNLKVVTKVDKSTISEELNEADITRINKEIATLKQKVA